jgi:hypothetical protein
MVREARLCNEFIVSSSAAATARSCLQPMVRGAHLCNEFIVSRPAAATARSCLR